MAADSPPDAPAQHSTAASAAPAPEVPSGTSTSPVEGDATQTDEVLKRVPLMPHLWVPYTTHAAADSVRAKPPGTRVRRGEPVTETVPQSSHAPLAPADGVIAGIESVKLLDGRQAMAVSLEPHGGANGAGSPPGGASAPASPRAQPAADLFGEIQTAERGTWIEDMLMAGIWAERWGSPDLIAQLHQSMRRPVDTVVCSVLDPDRAVPLQSVVAGAFGAELSAGVALLAKLAGAERAWVVADVLSPDAFQEDLRKHAEAAGARLVPLPNEYPQADPTLLLHALLQRRLPPDHLPTDAGVLLVDAAAAVAVGRFAKTRRPMLTVPLAVYDAATDRNTFLEVPVGTVLEDVLEFAGVRADCVTFRGGPPPRDLRLTGRAVVGGAELTVYVTPAEEDVNPDPCIRSGWCVEACPVRIHPAGLLEAAQSNDADLAESYGLAACIECGICNYVCPSRLPLLEGIRSLRRRGANR